MKILLSVIFLIASFICLAQDSPVQWQFSQRKVADRTYEIRVKAIIDKGWHIYTQQKAASGVGAPTKISFLKNPMIILTGKTAEIGAVITEHVDILDTNLKYYEKQVEFVQTIKLKASVVTNISGKVSFMACTNQKCLREITEPFSVTVGK